MNKFTCIYCKKELPISEQTEDHIIPESLGSPLKINNVCKKCNNFVGSELESELLYFPAIVDRLSKLGISSKSGKQRPFIKTGKRAKATMKDPITGEEVKTHVKLGYDGENHKIIPTKTASGHLIVDMEDFEKKKRELESKGYIVISKLDFEQRKNEFTQGTKLAIFDTQPVHPSPQIKINFWFNIKKISRAIAKSGLAYLCYKYGSEKTLFSNFDSIRSYILNGKPEPRGSFNYDIPYWPSKENHHALHLFTVDKKLVGFIIDFFGAWKSLITLGTYFESVSFLEESKITYIEPISRNVFIIPCRKIFIENIKGLRITFSPFDILTNLKQKQ